ncbi:MAG: hypothetical protein ACD_28C00115G0007 [uncultured bacterium]|nr:MAG: hypothetical protein ACD_28C00115G0007 [uncultured bacterium]
MPTLNLLNIRFIAKALRVNDQIRARTVRLIDDNDEQLGIKSIEDARRLATEKETDLVEVAPNVNPPVCKLMDYGKYLYRQKKLEQKQRAKSKKSEVKGIRLSLRTDTHDLETKIKKAKQFLGDGHSLKIALIFKGRELSHFDLAVEKMNKVVNALTEVAKVDQPPKKQGYNLFAILSPLK